MKYSFSTTCFGSGTTLLPAYSLEETMRILSGFGYEGVEIACHSPHAWPYYMTEEKRALVNEWQEKYGIAVSAVMAPPGGGPGCNVASTDKAERRFSIQLIKDVIEMGHQWKCKRLAFIAGWHRFGVSHAEAWGNTLNAIKEIGAYALERDMVICIEPTATDSNVVETPDDALKLIEESGLSNIGVMFDMQHAFFRKDDPVDYVYTIGKYLKNVHLTDYDRLTPGSGGADFYPVMQALKDIDYDGYVTMETGFARTTGLRSITKKAIDFLKNVEKSLI
ncbi:MAG: sugar phosphate isomerase/epimerase family protein [Christensenellales bacterium]